MDVDLTNLTAILAWIVSGPGAVAVSTALFSWLASNSTKWVALPTNVKFVIMLAAAPVFALLAQVLLGYTDLLTQVQPWFQIAMVAALGWISSQKAYSDQLRAGYGKNQPRA